MTTEFFYIANLEETLHFFSQKGDYTHIPYRLCTAINATISGRARLKSAGREIILDSKHPVLIPKGTDYRVDYLEDCEYVLFCFDTVENYCRIEELPALRREIWLDSHNAIKEALTHRSGGGQQRALSELYALLATLFVRIESDGPTRIAQQAAELIHLGKSNPDFRCSELIRTLPVSEPYLRRIFRQRYNMSPRQYLEHIRMQQARLYLHERRSVSETALAVGYSDIYQFSRCYRRYYGYPPSKECESTNGMLL